MKKKLFLLSIVAVGMIAATGCSQKSTIETPESTPGAISFRTTHDFAKTRGAEETTGTINVAGQKFTVWGEQQTTPASMLMNNVEVTFDASANHFKSDNNYYWPVGDEEVKFWAVKNNYSGTPNVTGSAQTITDFEVAKAHSSTEAMTDLQKDLITAYNVGKKSTNEDTGMSLNFKHALSQIEFKATNPSTTTYDVYVAGVALYNIKGKGNLTFQSSTSTPNDMPTWSNQSEPTHYHNIGSAHTTKIEATATPLTQGPGAGSNFMLIPQQITGYTASNQQGAFARVFIRVVDKVSSSVLLPQSSTNPNEYEPVDIPLQDILWEAGKKYVYTLNFGTGWGNRPFIPTPTPTPTPNPGVNPKPVINPVVGPVTPTPTPVVGKPIFFTVTVSNFGNGAAQNLNM